MYVWMDEEMMTSVKYVPFNIKTRAKFLRNCAISF